MLILILFVIGTVLVYLCMPTPKVEKAQSKATPQVVIRKTGKIFTQVDTSKYGRVPVVTQSRYEESQISSEEQELLNSIFK